jgi:ABC-type nitrate/sulfonate/bicarbonate transport system permease component
MPSYFGLLAKIALAWTIVFFIGIVLALGIERVEMRLLRWRPAHRKRA